VGVGNGWDGLALRSFGDGRGMPCGLGVNGPNVVKHYFSANLYAQRSSTFVCCFVSFWS
jgi:hypothetical protein